MKTKFLFASVAAAVALPSAASAAPVLFAGNGHLYEFIGGNFTWQQALAGAAAAPAIAGYTAHLVTLTSAAEDNFVSNILTNDTIWLAGTDEDVEGVWKWAAGPETGQIFFGPGAAPGAYSNWNAGEPNNAGNEDYVHTNFGPGNWNDVPSTFGSGGYVVEYSLTGVIPEPTTWALMMAGFGLAGGALRRRQKVAVRFA